MSSFTSPMNPVAPPAKKAKAVGSMDKVKSRREELDRLREKQAMRSAIGQKAPPAPAMPKGAPLDPRQSDIFPGAPKIRSSIQPPPVVQPKTDQNLARRLDQSFDKRSASPSRPKTRSPAPQPRPPPQGPPPGNRAKSAPPQRPPPPVGPPRTVKEAPDSTPSRSSQARPPPMTPGRKSPVPTPKPPPMAAPPSAATPPPMTPASGRKSPTPKPPPVEATPPPVSTPKVFAPTPPTPSAGAGVAPGPSPIPLSGPVPPSKSGGAPPTQSQTAPEVTTHPTPAPFVPGGIIHQSQKPTADQAPSSKPEEEVSKPSVESNPPEMQQPPVSKPESSVPPLVMKPTEAPANSRKDMIRNMHEFAETPSKPKAKSTKEESLDTSLLRLEKEVREHEKAKTDALRRVAELEEEVQKLKEQSAVVAETPRAPTGQVGFFSPLSPGLATPRSNIRKRMATPHPKHYLEKIGTGISDEENKILMEESVKYTPYEFTTDIATFIVRRPYGQASERDLWFTAGYLNIKQYEKQADVNKAETLEIVAQIRADGSTLALHGESFVRHRSGDDDADWKEFGDPNELDQPLGSVTYIDSDASEKDYSLDDIFREAEAARANYCTSVVSMGVGLKAKRELSRGKKNVVAAPTPAPMPAKETAEIGVGTEDLPFPGPTDAAQGGAPQPGKDQPQEPEQRQPQPAFEDESSDVVSSAIGAFVSVIFWILKTILWTFPVSVITGALSMFLVFVLCTLISMQFADDNGAVMLGAGIDTMFNRPGIV